MDSAFPHPTHKLDMSRRALVLDGLWYCLCPSFSVSACNRPISVFSAPRRRNTRPNGPRSFAPITSLRRCYSSDFPGIGGGHTETIQDYQHGAPPAPDPIIQLPSNNGPNSWEDGDEPCEQETKSRPAREEYKRPHRVPENFNEMTNEEMEQLLENLTAKSPTIRPVTHVLRTLVRDRHVHPGPRHYRALMLANTDARRGTPDLVRDLFREMDKHCITADSATLHAALQVGEMNLRISVLTSADQYIFQCYRPLPCIQTTSSAKRSCTDSAIDGSH